VIPDEAKKREKRKRREKGGAKALPNPARDKMLKSPAVMKVGVQK